MKKFTFHFSLLLGIGVSTLFLSACSTPDLTQPEIQDLYQKQLQSIENSFKTYFSPIPENYQTTTQLQLSSSKNSLDGQASYQSVKNTSLKKEEKSSISFQVDLKNFGENIPLQLSGALLSLYKDKEMYINIQDFSLFMGQGNAEAKFITLLAKQLANKRIALDKQEMIGISVIETPSYSEIIHNFLTLYTPLADITYTQDLQTKNRFLGTINTLSPDYLTSLETLLQLASDLAGIKLSRKNITLNPLKESTIEYQLPKKNTVEYTQRLYLTTETQTLTLYIEYIRGTLVVTLWEIQEKSEENITYDLSFSLTITPKNASSYQIKAIKTQDTQVIRDLDTNIKIQPEKLSKLLFTFEGDLVLSPFQLNNQENISLSFKGSETLQPSITTDFSLSWETIQLSSLLE